MKSVLLALGLVLASTFTTTAFAATEYDGANCRKKGDDELRCLVCAIWTEGKSTVDSMEAVASVVFARVHSSKYPDNVCDVVYQKSQFTGVTSRNATLPRNSETLDKVVEVASQLVRRGEPGPYLGFRAPIGKNRDRCKNPHAVQIGKRGNCYQKSGEADLDFIDELNEELNEGYEVIQEG